METPHVERPDVEWDYIVVGAGSAGCALTHELVTDARKPRVLVLEAGGTDRSPYIRLQAGAFQACLNHDWGYRAQPDPTRHGLIERWWRGRVLGGCSSINSTIYVRGAARDFDRWGESFRGAHEHGWSAQQAMTILREIETSDQPGAARGHHGPLHVRTVKRPHPITAAFVESARASGYPFNPDYNDVSQEGVAYAQLSQRGAWRCSAADAFLKPLVGKRNLELQHNALVERIHIENGRAVAVSVVRNGRRQRLSARRIVLCAGTVNSPHLLMLSGIGDGQELRQHHIDVALHLPGVGRNVRDHPLVKMIYESRIPTHNLTGGLMQKLGFAAQLVAHGEGPIANVFESVAFLRSRPVEQAPDIQVHFVSIGYLAGPDCTYTLAPYPAVSVMINKSYPLSTSRIRLASANPAAAPLIESRLLQEEADVETLVQGMLAVRRIMQAQPIAELLVAERVPGPERATLEALRDFTRHSAQIANHPVGSCRMGTGPDAVVGPDLRVHGIENLWVADASIMPDMISGNTNAACMMIGKKLGKQLVAGASTQPQEDLPRSEPARTMTKALGVR